MGLDGPSHQRDPGPGARVVKTYPARRRGGYLGHVSGWLILACLALAVILAAVQRVT